MFLHTIQADRTIQKCNHTIHEDVRTIATTPLAYDRSIQELDSSREEVFLNLSLESEQNEPADQINDTEWKEEILAVNLQENLTWKTMRNSATLEKKLQIGGSYIAAIDCRFFFFCRLQ